MFIVDAIFGFVAALMDDQGEYILNGYNVIALFPKIFPYGGVTFEYTGTNSSLERVNTTFAKRLKRDLTIEVIKSRELYVYLPSRNKSINGQLFTDFITKRALCNERVGPLFLHNGFE